MLKVKRKNINLNYVLYGLRKHIFLFLFQICIIVEASFEQYFTIYKLVHIF